MNLTFLALSISLGLSVIIYLIYKRSSKSYTVENSVKEPKDGEWEIIIDELESSIELSPVLGGTIDPEPTVKKEGKPKTPKKKSTALPSVSGDELPKPKKSTYKKSYNRKKKDTKKDKGDDLLLS